MLKKVFKVFLFLVVVFVVIVSMQPAEFRIERSTAINAPAEVVFDVVNDFHAWEAWSPWAKLDPASKAVFEGPDAGVGAVFKWSGNKQVGEGAMTITESTPHERIKIRLDFVKPFKAVNQAEFSFVAKDGATVVTWSMAGQNKFFSKALCLFMDVDKMVGADFEKGLASMKSTLEGAKEGMK